MKSKPSTHFGETKKPKLSFWLFFAEEMGFEPTIQLPIYKLSRLAP
jgi:hypothetical protein